jgi:glutamate N-acetyltransferase/amino-acid N-acetyltransferase
MGVTAESVLPFSTGVIGEYLPVEKIAVALPLLQSKLQEDNWLASAKGIMTTDTVAKAYSEQLTLDCGTTVTISGISKGAGMICPDMATMLAYIATDAAVEEDCLQAMLAEAVDKSFNSITVDGDTSTNDACVLMATAKAAQQPIRSGDANADRLQQAISKIMQQLAQAIVRDAEGATKFVSIEVSEARDVGECKQLAYTIAHSPLVKTALFASDPNWGRILAAIGRAGLNQLDLSKVNFSLNGVSIVKDGGRDPAYTEEAGAAVMLEEDITISISLGRGTTQHTLWTCDLSYDYVKINAEYRT